MFHRSTQAAPKGYYQPEHLYFSLVFGGSQYVWTGRQVPDPILGDDGHDSLSPILKNVQTGELFFLKRIDDPDVVTRQYIDSVQIPPRRLNILWPSDLVAFRGEPSSNPACGLSIEQHYHYNQEEEADLSGVYRYGLLFPFGGYPAMERADRLLTRLGELTWRNPNIQLLLCRLAAGFAALNRQGYFYLDIHFSRLFFLADGSLYFNFSNLVFPLSWKHRIQSSQTYNIKAGSYPVEFAEPALVQGRLTRASLNSQNYSLAALFFYLMFGRYPYDGKLMDGYMDQTEREHYEKFRDYHQIPVFIFDPDDSSNALGEFAHEQAIVESWNALPQPLRALFLQVLRRENAERQHEVHNPGPERWLELFRQLGWDGDAPQQEG